MWASEYPTSSLGNTFLHNVLKILCLEQMFIIRAHIRNKDRRLACPDLCAPSCTRGYRQGPGKPCHALSSDFGMESWLNTITLNFNRWKISQGKWVWEMLNPMLSLVFVIHISSVGCLLENPASIKLFNMVLYIVKFIYIFPVNPQSTVKNTEIEKLSHFLRSLVVNGKVIWDTILLTIPYPGGPIGPTAVVYVV